MRGREFITLIGGTAFVVPGAAISATYIKLDLR
jgi:hypothetical protein